MIFVIDSEGCYIGFSQGQGLTPLLPPELFIGRRVFDVMPVEVARLCMSAIQAALETQELQVFSYELWEGDTFRQYECRIAAAGSSEVIAVVRDQSAQDFHLSRQARLHEREVLEARAEAAINGQNPYSLSFRELTVLDLMQQGMDDRDIARRLGLSRTKTLEHITSIMSKMAVQSRTEAAVRAIKLRLIPDSD